MRRPFSLFILSLPLLALALLMAIPQGNRLAPRAPATPSAASLSRASLQVLGPADDSPEGAPWIVGGEIAPPGAWPWMAALVGHDIPDVQSAQFCGGSLVDPNWVLTAAHCTTDYYGFPLEPNEIDIVIGRQRLSSNDGSRIPVVEIVLHPDYSINSNDADLALLRLATPAGSEPVGLPYVAVPDLETAGRLATTTGWGLTEDLEYSDDLRQVAVPLVSQTTCGLSYGVLNGELTNNMICAGYEAGGKDSCYGDSGGPLMVQEGGRWILVGIVSWGRGCAEPDYYGVYTRVSQFTDWILSKIPDLNTPTPTATLEITTTLTDTVTATPTPQRLFMPIISKQALAKKLENGNFEQGPVAWRAYSLSGYPLIVTESRLPEGVWPAHGAWAAWLGAVDNEISVLEQQMLIPTDTPVLSYRYWIASDDFCGYDFGGVVVDGVVVDLLSLCFEESTGGWSSRSVDLRAFSGKLVQLQFRAELDFLYVSSLFVDDVALVANPATVERDGTQRIAPPSKAGLLEQDQGVDANPPARIWTPARR